MIVNLQSRDFTGRDPLLVNIQPVEYSFSDVGGCYRAQLIARGSPNAVWALLNDLRCPVEIYDDMGVRVWWGYLHETVINAGAITMTASLSTMANKVQVAYSYVEAGSNTVGKRALTTAVTNAQSQSIYGVKEYVHSGAGMTAAEANALTAKLGADMAYPKGGISTGGSSSQEVTASLYCRGWWDTLFWRYPTTASDNISYKPISGITNAIFGNGTYVKSAQQFTVGANNCKTSTVSVRLLKTGTPSDNVKVSIQTDNGSDSPSGTELGSATLAGGSITTTAVTYSFTIAVNLTAATKYWIVVERSGAGDVSNYYNLVGSTTLGYAGGVSKYYASSAWSASSNDKWFEVAISTEITQFIKRLVDNYADFIEGIVFETTTSISVSAATDGTKTAGAIIEDLLAQSASSGRALLSTVSPERIVYIYQKPLVSTISYIVGTDGTTRTAGGDDIRPTNPPVGAWVGLSGVVPAVVDTGIISNEAVQYICGSAWKSGAPVFEYGESVTGTQSTQSANMDTWIQSIGQEPDAWDDLRIEPTARNTGTNAPAFEKYYDDVAGTSRGVYLYSFDDAAANSEKEVFFSMQMPHDWRLGTDIRLHVHWVGAVNDTTSAPRWGLEYIWRNLGDTFTDTTIVYSDGSNYIVGGTDANVTAGIHYISKFSDITPGEEADLPSSILIGRIFRNSSNAADTYNASGAKCGLLYIDAHYIRDSFGSNTEYAK